MSNELPEIASKARTRAIMETYGLTFKKSLGQNFLTDLNILKKIVAAAEVGEEDGYWKEAYTETITKAYDEEVSANDNWDKKVLVRKAGWY